MFAVYDEGTGKYLNTKKEATLDRRGELVYETSNKPTVSICYVEWEDAAKAAEEATCGNMMYDEVVVVEV